MKKTNDHKIVIITGIISLAIGIGIGRFCYTPILPYMISEIGLTSSQAGLIASGNYFGYLIGSILPTLPIFPKKIKKLFFFSIYISISTIFLMAITTDINFFVIIRFFQGIFGAFVLILGSSLVVTHLQSKGTILLSTAHFSGVGFGMALSAIIISYLGFHKFNWKELWICMGLLCLILSLQILNNTPDQIIKTKIKSNRNNSIKLPFLLIIIAYGLYGFGYVSYGTFISTISRISSGLETTEAYIWFLVGIMGIPSVFFWNWLGTKIGNDLALFFANLILGSGILICVSLSNVYGIILSSILFGFSFIPITSMSLIEGQNRFSGSFVVCTAFLTFSFSVGQMIGPYFSGHLADNYGSFNLPLFISGSTLILSSILMINPYRFYK